MLEKKPGKYIHGGCGATIDLPYLNLVTECGLQINLVSLYCDNCKVYEILLPSQKVEEEINIYDRGC